MLQDNLPGLIRITLSAIFIAICFGCLQTRSDDGGVRQIRVAITGNLSGAVKDCNCPHGQPGGLARRKTIFDRIRSDTPDVLFLDCGELTANRCTADDAVLLSKLFHRLDYDVINCYPEDIKRLRSLRQSHPGRMYAQEINLPFSGIFRNSIVDSVRTMIGDPIYTNRFLSEIDVTLFFTVPGYEGNELPDLMTNSVNTEIEPARDTLPFVFDEKDLAVLMYNLSDQEIDNFSEDLISLSEIQKSALDLIIIGGGGFLEPEVVDEDGILYAYPGVYGEYVLILDLWIEKNSRIHKYEWEAVPSESVLPDSSFQIWIDSNYQNRKVLNDR